jgi:transmembrane sensor
MTSHDADIEAADWFAKRKTARDREEMEPAFQAWLQRSTGNREAYDRVDHAWGVLETMHTLGLLCPRTDELGPATGLWPTDASKSVRPDLHSRYTALGIALIVVAVLVSIAVLALPSHRPAQSGSVSRRAPDWVTYETGAYDSVMPVALPGNSVLKLDSDTKIKVRQSTTQWEVILEHGDVEFTIAPAENRPFEVTAGKTTVRVLNTVFSMQRGDDDDVRTIVSHGSVKIVSPSYAATELAAGEAAHVCGQKMEMEKPLAAADDERLAWLRDKLVFGRGEPLAKIVRQFNRYNRERLEIVDPTIEEQMIGGIFDKHDPETFAFVLSRLHIHYAISESTLFHSKVILLSAERP